jgi:hypothetical protein
MFGKNKFDVLPLYQDEYPKAAESCGTMITLPYSIADSLQTKFHIQEKPLTLLYIGLPDEDSEKQLSRVKHDFKNDINLQFIPEEDLHFKECTFFLTATQDLVLLDERGAIRGQYISNERKEMDRLVTELAILLKQY